MTERSYQFGDSLADGVRRDRARRNAISNAQQNKAVEKQWVPGSEATAAEHLELQRRLRADAMARWSA